MRNGHFRPQRRQIAYDSGDEMPANSSSITDSNLTTSSGTFSLLGSENNRAIFDTSKYPFDEFRATLATAANSALNETITIRLRDTINGQSYPSSEIAITSASREPVVSDFTTVSDSGVIEFGLESKVSTTAITGTVFSAQITLWGVL